MVPLLLLGTAITVIWLVNTGGVGGLYAIPLFLGVLYFWMQPAKIVMILSPALVMTLLVPGLPGTLTLVQALVILLAVWGVFNRATVKGGGLNRAPSDWAMIAFVGVILLLMFVRGFGMRLGGGTKYGGFGYVLLLTSAMAYFFAPYVTLSRKNIVWILGATVAASFVPFLVELSIILTGGGTGGLMSFFTLLPEYTMESVRVGEAGLARISSGRTLGIALIMVGLVVRFSPVGRVMIRPALVAVGFGLVLLSGFRSVFIMVTMVMVGWVWALSRHRWMTFVLLTTGALALWGTAVLLGSAIPSPLQRAISFLPGVYVDPLVAANAQASLDWRFEIWAYCVKRIPEYLLVGRGIVTEVLPLAYMRREFYLSPEFYYEMKGYHSGPLSLLLDFGLPGLIAGTAFFFAVCAEGWRFLRRVKPDYNDVVWRYYLFLLISATVSALSFYLITGDVRASIPIFVIDAIMLRLIRKHLEEAKRAPVVPVPRPTLAGWRAALPPPDPMSREQRHVVARP